MTTPQEMQQDIQKIRQTQSVGFVPTMGALHEGHLQLVQKSRAENDKTIVSIFVNPTQFNNPEDLAKYPRTLEQDQKFLEEAGVDFLFLPTFDTLYPDQFAFSVNEKNADHILCGASRPGHFAGVLTVVLKLLNITQPHRAYFGEKDYQQLSLIQSMVAAFFIPTQIVPVPTIRDAEGLALSSRNQRLSPTGLSRARRFAQTLRQKKSREDVLQDLSKQDIQIDYLEDYKDRRFAAVFIDNVRLIDNVPL